MKTMQEVQTLISDLQQFYTDVRLLDAAAIERIEEGVRSDPKAEDLCYACRHAQYPQRVIDMPLSRRPGLRDSG